MTQLGDDCFASDDRPMTAAEALAMLAERIRPVTAAETVPLRRAVGRILSQDVIADRDVPPADNSAVDGYALRFADLAPSGESRLPVTGRAAAGHPMGEALPPGHAARIFTGAAVPAGCDTVVMQEDVRLDGDTVVVPPGLGRGANVRRAGEDVAGGATVLTRGTRLRPQEVGLAASLGREDLAVYCRLRVALFSTGDELSEPGRPLAPGGIYDANRYVLAGLIEALGCEVTDLGILPDDGAVVREALARAAEAHDLLVTSGGVSVGDEDHVRAAVEALGSIHSWRLAIKPGRPIAMGQVGRVPFVGLPGNPVAAMVCFLRFARPLILRLAGATGVEPVTYRVRADFDHEKKPHRREWVRARLAVGDDGIVSARRFPAQGSGILTSMVESDGLVELPEDVTRVRPGETVDFLPFNEVCR